MLAHGPLYYDLRHDFFRVCVYVAANSLLANLLPAKECMRRWPRCQAAFGVFVYFVALGALNLRRRLPSLGAWRVPMGCK
jgi:hypothetical protein